MLQRMVRGPLASRSVDSRRGGAVSRELLAALSAPELSAPLRQVESADSVLVIGTDPLHAMPILDLRLRKAIRHAGTRVVIASERPTALDGGAEETVRYAPGEAGALLAKPGQRARATATALATPRPSAWPASSAPARRSSIYGEELGHGPDRERRAARPARLRCGASLRRARRRHLRGPGGLQRPRPARGRLHARPPDPGSRETDGRAWTPT